MANVDGVKGENDSFLTISVKVANEIFRFCEKPLENGLFLHEFFMLDCLLLGEYCRGTLKNDLKQGRRAASAFLLK